MRRLPLHHRKQAGNALFLILIAVALFAALSYAITQSGRGGSGGVNKEQIALQAAQIVQRVDLVRVAVQRMTLTGGVPNSSIKCTDTPDVNYDCDNGAGHASPFCTTGTNCLFSPTGGGAEVPVFPASVFTSAACTHRLFVIDGFNSTPDTVLPGVGTGLQEDLAKVFCLSDEICTAINRGLGITGIPDEAVSLPSGQESMCFRTSVPATFGNNYVVTLAAH